MFSCVTLIEVSFIADFNGVIKCSDVLIQICHLKTYLIIGFTNKAPNYNLEKNLASCGFFPVETTFWMN